MMTIPIDERAITDEEVLSAFDFDYPGLERVKAAMDAQNIESAKAELVRYFETRTNVRYYYDYRQLPLRPVETDTNPYLFQSSMGLKGSLKEFILFAGNKMMEHIYVRPGRERKELDLGASYENMPHFNYFEDQGKKHRTTLDIFVRGIFAEYLSVLYHETGDQKAVDYTEEFLHVFWENYPLNVAYTQPDVSHFSRIEERDVMSVGWLVLNYITLLYTRVPYEMHTETAFELIKHLWFLGMQFRRFDTDSYRKYNHHMWERGIVPFIVGTLFPEIPAFSAMKERGSEVIRLHIRDDFNEEGGYNEHSIPYWCGAALAEMICRSVYIARLNHEELLDEDTWGRISKSFDILAMISAPGDCYPSLGDNGGSSINPVLQSGAAALGNRYCEELLEYRIGGKREENHEIPLDYCNDRAGFFCSKSSLGPDANYILMSAKVKCGTTGHNHMDLLSLFINIHGQELIGEPYARELYHTAWVGSEQRGYLYNMESHNTVLVYGEPIQPDSIYASKWGVIRPDTPITRFETEKEGCYAEAYHDAYTHCRHVRKILSCRSRGFLIRDELIGGNRMQKPNVQRWHLFPDVKYEQIGTSGVLLEKNGAKALLLWGGTPVLRFWKKKELSPMIVKEEADIAATIDVEFMEGAFNPAGGLESVTQDLLVLDVTEEIPDLRNITELCGQMLEDAKKGKLAAALEQFSKIK
ncbi:MAG: heparinase II/III family protein [Lachnospiraceae bacterium]